MKIIDVSKHNGVIDWAKAKGEVQCAIIRMGFRGYSKGNISYDSQYKTNVAGCKKYGVPFSLYFFPCSINEKEAQEEADFIIREVKTNMTAFPVPVFLDSEISAPGKTGRSDKLSKSLRTKLLKIIVDRCQNAGIPMGIYASTSWLNNQLDMSQLPYSVWVAQYASTCKYTGSYLLWQYTSKGTCAGIKGYVDFSKVHTAKPTAVATNCPCRTPQCTVQYGMRGDVVRWVQWWLDHKGYSLGKYGIDGNFGASTKEAVLQFQRDNGLTVNGIVETNTKKALQA